MLHFDRNANPFWYLASLAAALDAAACGQPDKLRCVFRFELTWPLPLQFGVGHFKMVSCIAKTFSDCFNNNLDFLIFSSSKFRWNIQGKEKRNNFVVNNFGFF